MFKFFCMWQGLNVPLPHGVFTNEPAFIEGQSTINWTPPHTKILGQKTKATTKVILTNHQKLNPELLGKSEQCSNHWQIDEEAITSPHPSLTNNSNVCAARKSSLLGIGVLDPPLFPSYPTYIQ